MANTTVVCEIGSNWAPARPFESLTAMVQAAAETGADFVKGQDFHPLDDMDRPQDWKDRCAPWTLPPPTVPILMREANKYRVKQTKEADRRRVKFLCSVFTPDAVARARRWGYSAVKIASSEIGNEPLLRAVGDLCPGRPIWLSTGEVGDDWGKIDVALDCLENVWENVVLMHCVAQYPTPAKDANLERMVKLREWYGLPTGWSSHVAYPDAVTVAARAVEMGAVVVEAHLRTDTTPISCPDNGDWSLCPTEFAGLVEAVRGAES